MSSNQDFVLGAKLGNGAIAGIVGVTCTFPVDLCKTRLQNTVVGPNGERMYTGILDCGKKTFRAEGFRGLYRGWAVNTLLITPEKCIKLVFNDVFRQYFGERSGNLRWYGALAAGALAGGCQVVVTTPMELLKIQRQDAGRSGATLGPDGKAIPAKTAMQITKELFAERGFFGLYKGFRPTLLRDVIFSAVYFPSVAYFNKVFLKLSGHKETDKVFYLSFVAAFLSGSIASITVNPFDVVKTRLQTLQKGKGEKTYSGIADCFVKVYQTEGWKAFYKGGKSRVIAIALLFGIAQTVYWLEICERLFYRKHRD